MFKEAESIYVLLRFCSSFLAWFNSCGEKLRRALSKDGLPQSMESLPTATPNDTEMADKNFYSRKYSQVEKMKTACQ